jgi:hypothetical protein
VAHAREDTGEGATAAARGRVTRGERATGAERRRGQGSDQGEGPAPAAEREAEEAEGVQRWKKGKSPRADLENFESSGVSL